MIIIHFVLISTLRRESALINNPPFKNTCLRTITTNISMIHLTSKLTSYFTTFSITIFKCIFSVFTLSIISMREENSSHKTRSFFSAAFYCSQHWRYLIALFLEKILHRWDLRLDLNVTSFPFFSLLNATRSKEIFRAFIWDLRQTM